MKNKYNYVNKKYTLIKFYLLKYQIYKNQKNQTFFKQNLEKLNIQIKQTLNIIYLYHVNKKKILFVGFPYIKFMLNKFNHFFIPKSSFNTQLINNSKLSNKNFSKMDLIVFFNVTVKELEEIKKFNKKNIPIISFGNELKNKTNFNYNIFGYFSKPQIKQFFFFLILSILRKNNKFYDLY